MRADRMGYDPVPKDPVDNLRSILADLDRTYGSDAHVSEPLQGYDLYLSDLTAVAARIADLDEALALLREADPLLTWRTDSNGPDRRGWLDRRDALLAKHPIPPTED